MNCDRALETLVESLDEPLGAAERAELEAHLAACPACMAALRGHVVLRAAMRELDASSDADLAPLPAGLAETYVAAMRAARDRGADTGAGGANARIA